MVARARAQASGLAARLGELGANVLEAPAITLEELPFQAPDLGASEIVCLTSANGVERLLAGDVRALAGVTVAAVGSATAAARRRASSPTCSPGTAVQRVAAEALGDVAGRRVLIATAEGRGTCWPPACVSAERRSTSSRSTASVRQPVDAELVRSADLVTFTSSSAVTNRRRSMRWSDHLRACRLSIGPVTSGTLRERGVEPVAEADPHDVDGLVAAVLAVAAG